MLKPAWGYVDQPPLTPLSPTAIAALYDGGPWLLRDPGDPVRGRLLLLTALLARELGGDAKAQAWTAWGMATTSAVLLFGHVFLTSSADLVAWPLVSLLVIRAELRAEPRWWLAAGAVAGLATYNKLLVACCRRDRARVWRWSVRADACCRRTSWAAPARRSSWPCPTCSTR